MTNILPFINSWKSYCTWFSHMMRMRFAVFFKKSKTNHRILSGRKCPLNPIMLRSIKLTNQPVTFNWPECVIFYHSLSLSNNIGASVTWLNGYIIHYWHIGIDGCSNTPRLLYYDLVPPYQCSRRRRTPSFWDPIACSFIRLLNVP